MQVLKVENIYKQYELGQVSTGTMAHDFNRWLHKIRGKEDPYLKITEKNTRDENGGSNFVWALDDISFDVNQGDVVGIIGSNGAGKSTLLKILSKVTSPTKGSIKIKGRIASLLEVGTGFHPDLSGRENIFLNGAILGMTKKEIDSKFDEIVEFSEIGEFLDTPVKRYSSGMYVRLAFAVAALCSASSARAPAAASPAPETRRAARPQRGQPATRASAGRRAPPGTTAAAAAPAAARSAHARTSPSPVAAGCLPAWPPRCWPGSSRSGARAAAPRP